MWRGKTDTNSEHETMLMSGNVDMGGETHHDIVHGGIMEGLQFRHNDQTFQ